MTILTSVSTYFMAFVNLIALTMATVIHTTNLTIAWLFFVLVALILFLAVLFVSYFIFELFRLIYLRWRAFHLNRKYVSRFKPDNKEKK